MLSIIVSCTRLYGICNVSSLSLLCDMCLLNYYLHNTGYMPAVFISTSLNLRTKVET